MYKFDIIEFVIRDIYCIRLSNNNEHTRSIFTDKKIAEYIALSIKEYYSILESFNGKELFEYSYPLFKNKEDAKKCAEYLNEQYGCYLALRGD